MRLDTSSSHIGLDLAIHFTLDMLALLRGSQQYFYKEYRNLDSDGVVGPRAPYPTST